MLISKDFRLGMGDEELFVEIDHMDEMLLRAEFLRGYWDQVRDETAALTMPEPELQLQCKACPLFFDCLGKDVENHILEIPRLSQKKFDSLKQLGIVRIDDIPPTFELTPYQATVRDCVVTKKSWARKQLKEELDAITWPAFYLDFETVMTAIPLYPNIAPYTQIPTQYSIHKCSDVGKVLAHKEFLCDHQKDSRKELAQNLIRDIEKTGSIITYSNFEKMTVNGLAKLYPDLSDSLVPLVDRMVDLGAIIRQNFYHPGFHGSTSVKVTLPMLVPEMSYDDLEIAEGDSASAAFAYLALRRYETEAEIDAVKRNLLDYCARDTMAMVRLHERLYAWE
jgi:predicted RecB family nuclease